MKTYPFAEYYTIIRMIEEYYDAKRFLLNKERMNHLQTYGYSGLELEDNRPEIRNILNNDENTDTEEDLAILEILGIQLYRRYFFVATYQHFEKILISSCQRVEEKFHLTPFCEIKGKSRIDKCRNYLIKVKEIEIPPENLWRTITIYNKLRNCIIHSNACINSDQEGGILKKYVDANPLLHFVEIDGEMDDEIFFDKGFCEEAMDFFEKFLENLGEQVDDSFMDGKMGT